MQKTGHDFHQGIGEDIIHKLSDYKKFTDSTDNAHSIPTFRETMGTPNMASDLLNQLKQEIGDKNFTSVDEISKFIQGQQMISNTAPIDDFLGLTSEHMYSIMYSPFSENKDLVELTVSLEEKDSKHIPILDQMYFFLTELKKVEPLDATIDGHLPEKFIQHLHNRKYGRNLGIDVEIEVKEEEDNPLITIDRHLLAMAGYIEIEKNKFFLTAKGTKMLEQKTWNTFFTEIFHTYGKDFNWGYTDWNEEIPQIQQTLIFNLYILKMKAGNYIDGKNLGKTYFDAFPQLESEVTNSLEEPEDQIIHVFIHRFLRRFSIAFGLVTMKTEGKNLFTRKEYFRKTPLFDRLFQWKM